MAYRVLVFTAAGTDIIKTCRLTVDAAKLNFHKKTSQILTYLFKCRLLT